MRELLDNLFPSIRSRLIGGVVLIHILLMGLVVFDMLTRQQAFMEKQVANEGMNLAATLAANSPSWLISNDLNGLDELVDSLAASVKHLRLGLILDADGSVKASTDPSLMGLVLDDAPSRHLVDALNAGRDRFFWHDGMVDTIAEITANGKRIGYARVILDATPVQAELDAVERRGIVYTLVAILLGALIAWLLVRTIVRHLETLSRAADNIAAGNLDVKLPVSTRKDEVARLTRDFAQMADALERDISERNRLEENLRRMNENLEEKIHDEVAKNRAKDHLLIQQSRYAAMGTMARNIAHHWRQPLNALSIQLINIRDEFEYHELTMELLESDIAIGMKLINRMSATIDAFRDFFLTDSKKEIFSLQHAVDSAVGLIAPDFENLAIALEIECVEDSMVNGYMREFAQAILNLLDNARDALIRSSTHSRKVAVRVWRENGEPRLSVSDNGDGVPPDVLPHVFEPYFSTKEMGTGLGLYMARTCVEGMGGSVLVENPADGGARFVLVLHGDSKSQDLVPVKTVA